MISKKALASIPLTLVLLLGVSACAPETTNGGSGGSPGSNSSQNGDGTGTGSLDADGFAIPGEPITLKIGDFVDYYSMPNLTKDEAQRVTVRSFEYIDIDALPSDAPVSEMTNGVLVLEVSWESLMGDVQSNDGYILVTHESGEEGKHHYFGGNFLDNGGVDEGETRVGDYIVEIPRGKTTVTIEDYTGKHVAVLHLDTSK